MYQHRTNLAFCLHSRRKVPHHTFGVEAGGLIVIAVLRRLTHLVLFALCLSASTGHAVDYQAEFIAAAVSIPNALIGRYAGISAEFDNEVRSLVTTCSQIAIRNGSSKEIDRLNNDGRITAHWRKTRSGFETIYDFKRWLSKPPETRAQLALHECIRERDRDKRLSTTLWALAYQKYAAGEEQQLVNAALFFFRQKFVGGVVGVGGGGEVDTFVFRNALINNAQERYNNDPSPENRAALNDAILSRAEIHYFNPKRTYGSIKGGVWKPTKEDIKRARCLYRGNDTCPTKSRGLPSEPCSCNGIPGVTIFPGKQSTFTR